LNEAFFFSAFTLQEVMNLLRQRRKFCEWNPSVSFGKHEVDITR